MLPFLGTQLLNKSSHIDAKVYVKPTNSALLLHYKCHVDERYMRSLFKTMLDRAFRLSSNWSYFSEECDRVKVLFSRLKYPHKLINSTITRFIAVKVSDQPVPPQFDTFESDPVRVVLLFKVHLTPKYFFAKITLCTCSKSITPFFYEIPLNLDFL